MRGMLSSNESVGAAAPATLSAGPGGAARVRGAGAAAGSSGEPSSGGSGAHGCSSGGQPEEQRQVRQRASYLAASVGRLPVASIGYLVACIGYLVASMGYLLACYGSCVFRLHGVEAEYVFRYWTAGGAAHQVPAFIPSYSWMCVPLAWCGSSSVGRGGGCDGQAFTRSCYRMKGLCCVELSAPTGLNTVFLQATHAHAEPSGDCAQGSQRQEEPDAHSAERGRKARVLRSACKACSHSRCTCACMLCRRLCGRWRR